MDEILNYLLAGLPDCGQSVINGCPSAGVEMIREEVKGVCLVVVVKDVDLILGEDDVPEQHTKEEDERAGFSVDS